MTATEKRYWEDLNWARTHHTELLARYQGEWIAIFQQQVVAHGPNGGRVESTAIQNLADKAFVMYFVESADSIYAGQSLL